mmetsp:Transcript_24015/g.36930  ORF Transcript_24015/g.36930 Transcript_24015/m.36930 type:complete len:126 (-) Transcript_24015:2275-2652(-)
MSPEERVIQIKDIKQFQECQLSKKIVPLLPNGEYPAYKDLIHYKRQKELKDKKTLQVVLNNDLNLNKNKDYKITQKNMMKKINRMQEVKVQLQDRKGFTRKKLNEDEIDKDLLELIKQFKCMSNN